MGGRRNKAKITVSKKPAKANPGPAKSKRMKLPLLPVHEDEEVDFETASESENQVDIKLKPIELSQEDAINIDLLSCAEKAVSIELICEKIFQRLSFQDLLSCSLVSRTWNSAARAVLRDSRKCLAAVRPGRHCKDLVALNDLVGKSRNIPFNGLSVTTQMEQHDVHPIRKCLEKCCNVTKWFSNFLTRVNIKYFKIACYKVICIPSMKVIEKIFETCAENFVGLYLTWLPVEVKSLTRHYKFYSGPSSKREHWLPNLKILVLQSSPRDKNSVYDLQDYALSLVTLKELVYHSPKLEELWGRVPPEALNYLKSKNKLHTVKEFHMEVRRIPCRHKNTVGSRRRKEAKAPEFEWEDAREETDFEYDYSTCLDHFEITTSHGKSGELRLKVFELDTKNLGERMHYNTDDVSGMMKPILKSSYDCIHSLRIEHVHLRLLLTDNVVQEPLISLAHLKVERYYDGHMYTSSAEPNVFSLSRVNLPFMFPNLEYVELHDFDPDELARYIPEQSINKIKESAVEHGPCLSVKKVRMNFAGRGEDVKANAVSTFFPWVLQNLAKLFPNLKTFLLDYCGDLRSALPVIWTGWPELEELSLALVHDLGEAYNFDSYFTGLSKDAVNLLNTKNYNSSSFDSLKPETSIVNMKKLKVFRCRFNWLDHWLKTYKDQLSGNLFLTERVGHFAFSRMPNLAVQFYIKDLEEFEPLLLPKFPLAHLKPYATFKEASRWNWDTIYKPVEG